jgi:peptidoglycan/xylan/chitin deacetylase (PgdA/CDA1 family)
MEVVLTFDVESDFSLDRSFNNIKDSLPAVVKILNEEKIRSTFFINGKVLEKFGSEVLDLLNEHEIASHGYNHKRLDKLNQLELENEIRKSKIVFSEYGLEPNGFRSPKLCANEKILDVVSKYYRYDSSIVPFAIPFRYFNLFKKRVPHKIENGLVEIPIGTINTVRMPAMSSWIFNFGKNYFYLLESFGCSEIFVMLFHSFDFANYKKPYDLPGYKYNFYYKKCGPEKLKLFRELIQFFRKKNSRFVTCEEFMEKLS